MPNQPIISYTVLIIHFLKIFVGAFVLSFIIARLTKWSIVRSLVITVISTFISYFIASVFITLPITLFSLSFKMGLCAIHVVFWTRSILLEPIVHIAVLRTISQLYLSKDKEYMFGWKAYLLLVLFRCGVWILNFIWIYFLLIIKRYQLIL